MGNLPNTYLPLIINMFNQLNWPVMSICAAMAVISFLSLIPLKETHGNLPPEKIEELEEAEKGEGRKSKDEREEEP